MLALRLPRCHLHSSRFAQFAQIRTIRTLPPRIPSYIKTWNPTKHYPTPRRVRAAPIPVDNADDFDHVARTSEPEFSRQPPRLEEDENGVNDTDLHRAYHKLRHMLRLADSPSIRPDDVRLPLWRAYTFAKLADRTFMERLSYTHWDIIWTSQAVKTGGNRNRSLHLERLYEDMQSVGLSFTANQRADYIEALYLNGKEEKALEEWESDHAESQEGSLTQRNAKHLHTGVTVHALFGDADRARVLMDELFRLFPKADPTIMMLVFRAHTSSKASEHHEHAKALYDQIKARLGNNISFRDYHSCFIGFLEAQMLYPAKRVFRDMVEKGFLARSALPRDIETTLRRLHMLYKLGTDIETMASIVLDAIECLPASYHTHLYFDWMKLSVVKQSPDAAVQILDMMYQHGSAPDTIHFNLFLRAMIRTKESPNVLKAENIGWRMIDEARKAPGNNAVRQTPDPKAPRKLPPADGNTFALIMHHHAKSLQWEHVDYLTRHLNEAGIAPNVTIMNVLIDNKIRKGLYAEAWETYKQLTNTTEGDSTATVFPNGASIRHLWKMLRLALGDYATRLDPNLPSPRILLRETIHWWRLCWRRPDAERFRMGLAGKDHGAISALMLHCFSYSQDLPGSLVAMHVLRQHFQIFPTAKVAQILERQMSWVNTSRGSNALRGHYYHLMGSKQTTQRIRDLYNMVLNRRMRALDKDATENMTPEEVGDAGLNTLSEFVRVVLKLRYGPELTEQMIDAAKRRIDFKGETGDVSAFQMQWERDE